MTAIEQLKNDVTQLKDRVDSQFTTIAAHAEIARQQAEFARSEARSDLDRSRDSLIGLIEQVRQEQAPDRTTDSSAAGSPARVEALEARIVELAGTVERCFARQNELADTMSAFLDSVLSERGEPVNGLSLA